MASSTFFFFLYAAIMHLSLTTTTAQPIYRYRYCNDDIGKYSANSVFAVNRDLTLSSLIANASTSSNGFYNLSIGQSPADRVYGLFQCRGDISPELCQTCIQASSVNISRFCPYKKEAIIWYDECMLRYADRSIFGIMETNLTVYMWSLKNMTVDRDDFNATFSSLMEGLITQAVSGSSKMFAAADKALSMGPILYGLVQCTSDISLPDCKECLSCAVAKMIDITRATKMAGRRVLRPICNARYEWYRFYNDSVAAAPPPATISVTAAPPPATISSPSPPSSPTSTNSPGLVGIIVGTSVSAAFLVILLLGFYKCRRKRADKEKKQNSQEIRLLGLRGGRLAQDFSNIEYLQGETQVVSQELPLMPLDVIKTATKHFSDENKLGEGGFGPVYKGTLGNGKEIAVKRLSRTSGQGIKELKNEVTSIARLQHKNLVKILGCFLEDNESLLIYEYMPNKSLDVFLFDSTRGAQLDWKTRLSILNGIARGLLYLHEDSRLKIIHRDLKASNILLDGEMNPKISDFGMARFFYGNQNEANTKKTAGTYGYMAPEYAMQGRISVKLDVFSFGVLLLEIISGKKNSDFHLSQPDDSLLTFVWKLWNKGQGLKVVDPKLSVQSCVEKEVLKCIHIGLLCVQENPADRPNMSFVVTTLETDDITLPQPKQPALCWAS